MASTEHKTNQRAEYACPLCEQPVESELRRHKTLGIYVPVWGPGPCHNPECPAHADQAQETRHHHRGHW